MASQGYGPVLSGKSVMNFLICSGETWFSFSDWEVGHLNRPIEPSNETDRVDIFDNSLSFGTKPNVLRQIFFEL